MNELTDINTDKLLSIVKVIKLTTDNLINKEVDGILKRPTTQSELEKFQSNIDLLIIDRLKKNFGV